jgi:proton-translocating NAD(P)+ transhydrogenase subunit alpha
METTAPDIVDTLVPLLFVLILAIFLGFELISKVPAMLHTPLMSGANAISGITVVGAIICTATAGDSVLATVLGTFAVACATVNVVGGFMVTDRMLKMFKRK